MNIDINGVRLHYEIHGIGEPLLWLHGFMGAGGDWRYIFADVPAGFQVIAPDLRGHGASTNPLDEFTFRQAAGDVSALLAHLGISATKAIGLSGGGVTLLHMATSAPAAISRMIVVSAPPYYAEQTRAIQRHFSPAMVPEHEMTLMRHRHRHGEQQIERLFAHARAFADDTSDVNFVPDVLARITADTLIVFGDRDPLYPVSLGVELYAGIPNSRLWVVPGGGHGPVFGEHAASFADAALRFLRG